MDKKILDDYYRSSVSLEETCKKLELSSATFYKRLSEMGLSSKGSYFKKINTGNKEIDKKMKEKYNSITQRSKGYQGGQYKSHCRSDDYITILEWVDFVNENKEGLNKMWSYYVNNGRRMKDSISVDRIDNSLPYYRHNIAFETTGFNAWKRNIRPIKVTVNNESRYFMSAEEASDYYGIRRQSIGDILRGRNKYNGKYEVEPSTVEEVLKSHELTDIDEYYNQIKGAIK